jgi:hypothetical protein
MVRRMPWVTFLWPGLPQLWIRGDWSSLAVAGAAAALLNMALLGSFGWSELIARDLRTVLWVALGVAWVGSAVVSVAWYRRQGTCDCGDSCGDAFGEALEHYLKGNWFQAQRVLAGLLRQNARDLDARLMLATLLRHTGRLEEATGELDLLTQFEGADKWALEIRRERDLLAEARKQADIQAEAASSLEASEPQGKFKYVA